MEESLPRPVPSSRHGGAASRPSAVHTDALETMTSRLKHAALNSHSPSIAGNVPCMTSVGHVRYKMGIKIHFIPQGSCKD